MHTTDTRARIWDIDGRHGQGDVIINDEGVHKVLADLVSLCDSFIHRQWERYQNINWGQLTFLGIIPDTTRQQRGQATPQGRNEGNFHTHVGLFIYDSAFAHMGSLRPNSTTVGDPILSDNPVRMSPATLQSVLNMAGVSATRARELFSGDFPICYTNLGYDKDGKTPAYISTHLPIALPRC
jgi:hypothetical protein